MRKYRDIPFDAFRGIAIIAAIAIHAAYMSFSIRNTPKGEWNFSFLVAYCQLLNFCIPAFFFISGYWMSKKSIESLEEYKTFLRGRLLRILIPYFSWSVLLLGYAAVREHEINVYQIIFKLMTGRAAVPYYPYYFIVVLAQLYIMTPLLHYINRKPYGPTLVILLNVIGLLALYLSRLKIIFHLPITLPFFFWIVFYEMGLLIGERADKLFPPKELRFLILPCLLVSVVIMGLESYVIISKFSDTFFAVSITRYSSFLYSVFVILGFLVLREHINHWPEFLVVLGRHSFGIYLIHMSILNKVFEYTRAINVVYSFQPLYQLIVISVTISACFIFFNIARKLLSEPFCEKILGF
jgi:surface polysaccharide O-acyltransferase-like enzyme